jgi:hypothetical protein
MHYAPRIDLQQTLRRCDDQEEVNLITAAMKIAAHSFSGPVA